MFLHRVLLNYIDIFISIEIWLFKFSYDYLEWVRWEITFVHEIIQDFLRILLDTHDVKGGLGFGAIIRAIVMWEKVRKEKSELFRKSCKPDWKAFKISPLFFTQ